MPLEFGGAIALTACPRLLATLIPTFGTVMRILHLHQLKIFLPIRSLFFERSCAKTYFHPPNAAVAANPRVGHIAKILISGHGTASKRLILDGAEQVSFLPRLHTSRHQITHKIF
jgi:hypothetical protein